MKKIFTISLIALSVIHSAISQESYQPSQGNLEAREWFQDAKFGLFVHWGVYCQMAGGGDMGIAEWIMNSKEIPIVAYENLTNYFNPIEFDPNEWVTMVKEAGMKYITITSKHHDGFAMFDSETSDYDVVERTPYGKDILKILKEECDRQGIKLFFYYSQLDWHHPDYYPRGHTGQGYTGRPEEGNWDGYINYMNTHLTELLTNYGPIGGIWFDGMWDKPNENWHLEETYSLIHKLQPTALIGSNHHKAPYDGEDFQMFERDLPGHNTMGFNQTGSISNLPLEMCETMNGSWGYNIKDRRFKSSKTLIHTLVKAAGYNANFLLNTGPLPNGKIQKENVDTLKIIGQWMDKYGETIYETRGGPIPPKPWGVTTINKAGDKIYVHVLDLDDQSLFIELKDKINEVRFFDDKSKAKFVRTDLGYVIQIPQSKRVEVDTILEIELRK